MTVPPFEHGHIATSNNPAAPIVVIGMHRSGTTLLTRLLKEAGVHMGDVAERNHESITFLQVNDEMLHVAGASWLKPEPFIGRLDDPSFVADMTEHARTALTARIDNYGKVSKGQAWGWKDPRSTLTLPVWLQLFPNARVVHITRNGIDVALSIRRRAWRQFLRPKVNNTERMFPLGSIVRGYRLWELYTNQGCSYRPLLAKNYFELAYESLLRSPVALLKAILNFSSVPLPVAYITEIAGSIVESPTDKTFMEKALVRILLSLHLLSGSVLLHGDGYNDGTAESGNGPN